MIIHTGDVSNGHGKREDMATARELLTFKKRTLFVPGNHDVTFDHSEQHEATFEDVFGPCCKSITAAKGLRFAFFNSQARANAATRNRAWMKLGEILSTPTPTILFCHATGMPDFYRNKHHAGWKEETMAQWTSLMKDAGVFAVLAGHFHRGEMHIRNGIPFHIAAPVVGWWGRQSSFRHWRLRDGRLTYRTVYV